MPRKKNETLHELRRQQILDAAKSCFIQQGFHATSMRQILEAAGMSSGGAYNYFASKDDIVIGLVARERESIEYLVGRLQKKKDPLNGIAQLVHDAIAYTDADEARLSAEIYAEALKNSAVQEKARENSDVLRDALQAEASKGIKSGSITSTHSPIEIAECLMALIEGYIGRVAISPTLKPKPAARMAKKTVLQLLRANK